MSTLAVTSFVAVGDSFTEGMDDPNPSGEGYRGWADLVAARLAEQHRGFCYANLAVRGKLIGQILDDQVPLAAAMRPDLVTLAGGLNDVMRPRCDMGLVMARVEECAATLAGASARLVLFRAPDPSRRMRGSARLMPRIERLIALIDELAVRHDALLVDLFSARVFDDPRLWSVDRIHLSTEGHRRVAAAVLCALASDASTNPGAGVVPDVIGAKASADTAWRAPLPARPPTPWLARRHDDLRWARVHLLPWIGRRLRGTSSGDGRVAKRPELLPFAAAETDVG
jgi:lysophospholipase L1-like esterase